MHHPVFLSTVPTQFAISIASLTAGCCLLALWCYGWVTSMPVTWPNLPWVALDEEALNNPNKARMQFMTNCTELLAKGLKTVNGPFQVWTGDGRRIVLPNSFANEISNNENMSFGESAIEGVFHTYDGFQPFGLATHHGLMRDVVRLKLTRSLDSVTPELLDEGEESLRKLLGTSTEWQETALKPFAYMLIARLSSRVFFGPDVCNNEEYLAATIAYTQDSFMAHKILRTWTPALRPFVHWFIPECQRVRSLRATVKRIVRPIIKERMRKGVASSKTSDMLGWIDDIAARKNIIAPMEDAQLFLAFAAIHTTTENLSYVFMDLLSLPGAIEKLREEMVDVLKQGAWTKTTFSRMKLLDSVLKESQRLHPVSTIMMERKLMGPVTLSTGLTLAKGTSTILSTNIHRSPEIYSEPDEFQPDRFLKMESSETATNSKLHFVSTSPEHLGFGHGLHSCPGRFFAANELKIALTQILLKYDLKLPEGGRLPDAVMGQSQWVPSEQKILFRRREVDLRVQV